MNAATKWSDVADEFIAGKPEFPENIQEKCRSLAEILDGVKLRADVEENKIELKMCIAVLGESSGREFFDRKVQAEAPKN